MQGTQQKSTEPNRLSPREGSSSCQEIRCEGCTANSCSSQVSSPLMCSHLFLLLKRRAARGRGRVSVLMLAKNCQAYPLRCLSCHEFIAPLVQHPWSCSALQRAWRAWQRTLCAHLKNVLKSKQSEHYICTVCNFFANIMLTCTQTIVHPARFTHDVHETC